MECRRWLNDATVLVAIDASVVINLNATRCPRTILGILPNRFVVVDHVVRELESGRQNGRNDADGLHELVASGEIEIVRLGDFGLRYFTELVSGSAEQTLDDGEAATIAFALEQSVIAVIDERKATKLCAEHYSSLRTGCTVDILLHPEVEKTLGRNGLAKAVFNALYFGRMRVPDSHVDWVFDLIGPKLAEKCVSLPKSVRCVGIQESS